MKEISSLFLLILLVASTGISFSAKVDTTVKVTSIGGDAKIYSQSEMQNLAELTAEYVKLQQNIADMKKMYHDMLVYTVQLMGGGTDPQTVSLVGGDDPTPMAVQIAHATGDLAAGADIIKRDQAKLDALGQQISQAQQGSGTGTLINGISVLTSTDLFSGSIITAGVNSYVTIDSGGESVTLTPGSVIYILVDKQQGVKLVNLIDGKMDVSSSSGLDGAVIVVGNKVVNHKDTSFFVERKNGNITVGSYSGVIGITDFGNMTFYAIPSTTHIKFSGNQTVTGALSSKKVGLAYLSLNDTISYSIKPVVDLIFDGPMKTETLTGTLSCNNKTYSGYFFTYSNSHVAFLPYSPVQNGSCALNFIGMDYFGNTLQHTSKFTTLCSNPDADHYLFYPTVYKVRKALDINSTLKKNLFVYDVKLYLLQNFSNVFVHVDSISPSGYVIKKDSFGNAYLFWPGEQKIPAETPFSYEINYTVLSFGVDYFDFLDFNLEGSIPSNTFLKSTQNIQSNNQEIASLASSLTGNTSLVKAHRIANWLRSNIYYDFSMEQDEGALVTLHNGTGICNGYATLFAALGRASGIPTKYDVGILATQGYHSFNEIYVNGTWIPVDPTAVSLATDYFGNLYNTQLKEAELGDLSDSVELFYAYTLDGYDKVYDYTGFTSTYNRNTSLSNYSELEPSLGKLYLLLYLQDTVFQSSYSNEKFLCNYYDNANEINNIVEICRKKDCSSDIDAKFSIEFEKFHDAVNATVYNRINQMNLAEAAGYPVSLADKTTLIEAKNNLSTAKVYFDANDYPNAIASLASANLLLYNTTFYDFQNWSLNTPDVTGDLNVPNTTVHITNNYTITNLYEPANDTSCSTSFILLLVLSMFFINKKN